VALRVTHYVDAADVLGDAAAFLELRPVEHNLILTMLLARAASQEAGRYWVVWEDAEPIGMVFQSPIGFRASLTPMPPEVARAAVEAIARGGFELPGVEGDAASAAAFAGHWTQVCQTGAAPVLGTRLSVLEQLTRPVGVAGQPRTATAGDVALVARWVAAFADELGEHRTPEAFVTRRVDAGLVTLWEVDGVAVGLVGRSPAVAGLVRIGPVYTPPAHRRRGYAGACVGAVSADALEDGHRCMLFTDLANPTSNSVYRALGYAARSENVRYAFDDPDTNALPLRSTATQ
jgi:GNAT superfamily N-acetyltransferase